MYQVGHPVPARYMAEGCREGRPNIYQVVRNLHGNGRRSHTIHRPDTALQV